MGRRIGGLSDIKTSQRAKIHSKPRAKGSEYLELYMLSKEEERLENYNLVLDNTKNQSETNLKEVRREIRQLENRVSLKDRLGEDKEEMKKRTPAKPLKTIVLDY